MENQDTRCRLKEKGCGGCTMLELPYEAQLQKKQKQIKKLLGKYGKPKPILGMENPWHYRNKVISTFTWGPGKKLASGIYAQGTHRVIPVKECLLHQPLLDEAVRAVRQAASEFHYPPYDEDRRTGLIRHVLVRHSLTKNQVLAVLVTASPILPGARAFANRVQQLCPQITTVIQNINPRSTSAVLGYQEKILKGKGYLEDTLCGIRFRLSASSFYQVNPVQTEILYRKAIEAADLDKTKTVLDAYCGVGTIGLTAARQAKSVLGVELNKSAVRCAVENARLNDIRNARFVCQDATAFIQKMAARGERVDVVFMDPPRAGSTPEFLHAVSDMGPEKLVYISCNPQTQSRDLELLAKGGWQVKMIQGVDMFPHTDGIESIVLLSKLH
ncbi:MAG TPA: 23S rRNA (uracil(1939)-C(5))-methyltransferase RlmD [Candidatus Blautia pullicola]|uniref:23S rRNA (Uracil(1939)-C(5))-methyltransferase RlmD n=1 Tax=Candidatus Blautia pullicola TaxID=2838498 RepID=A0A9D2FPG1_9FIRM|nr:23S rRNA (uracil(1939)-C(5))-methyltransferase RlmD [Candidatus Blautia pullicola]